MVYLFSFFFRMFQYPLKVFSFLCAYTNLAKADTTDFLFLAQETTYRVQSSSPFLNLAFCDISLKAKYKSQSIIILCCTFS